jgi:pimeloyl-ACP methyl ester carboxylesterase
MTTWFEGMDGLRLAADIYGPEDGVPVILTGGLGQIRQSWRRAAEQIAARGRRAITLDLRGHGESDRSPTGAYGYPQLSGDLRAVTQALGVPAILVGASLGGKISLAAAGYGGPTVAKALVMVDTAPRTRPEGIGNAVRMMAAPPEGFESPDAAAAELARARGKEPEPDAGTRLARNMRQDATGRWHWHWDRAYVEKEQGIGLVAGLNYLEEAASRVKVPMLLARGALSDVVDDAGAEALRALIPQAEIEVIQGVGHMIVGDANDAFAAALNAFLERTPGL